MNFNFVNSPHKNSSTSACGQLALNRQRPQLSARTWLTNYNRQGFVFPLSIYGANCLALQEFFLSISLCFSITITTRRKPGKIAAPCHALHMRLALTCGKLQSRQLKILANCTHKVRKNCNRNKSGRLVRSNSVGGQLSGFTRHNLHKLRHKMQI